MSLNRRQRSVLTRRIASQHRAHPEHQAQQLTPLVSDIGSPLPSAPHGPPQVMTMPLTLVEVTADGVQVSEALPLYTARGGAPIPASGPGRWQQLYAAGRP